MYTLKKKLHALFKRNTKSSLITLFIGLTIFLGTIIVAATCEYIAPYDPLEMNLDKILLPPNEKFIMGTDTLGRDIFSRVIYGTRISLFVAFTSSFISSLVGSLIGIISAYLGGKIDKLVSIPMDALYAFPSFILAMTVALMLGRDIFKLTIAISIPWIPYFYRITRGIVLSFKSDLIIEVAKSIGASDLHIILNYIVPNCISSIVVLITLSAARAIIAIAGIGFLGFGLPPPAPEWGTDVNMGMQAFSAGAWWPIIYPALTIFIVIFGFNLLGEGLDIIINPKHRIRY